MRDTFFREKRAMDFTKNARDFLKKMTDAFKKKLMKSSTENRLKKDAFS